MLIKIVKCYIYLGLYFLALTNFTKLLSIKLLKSNRMLKKHFLLIYLLNISQTF